MKKIILDNPLGSTCAKKFTIGEVVQWSGWSMKTNGDCERHVNLGVLVEIFVDTLGGREIVYGKVLPFKDSTPFDVNIMILKKVEK